MIPVITPRMMREKENDALPLPPQTLMERAGGAMLSFIPAGRVYIACGGGGNGGDGYVLARLLRESGRSVLAIRAADVTHPDALAEYEKARALKGLVIPFEELPPDAPDVWVDCLLGIGRSKPLAGAFEALALRMNADRERGAKVISCDIPTGLDAETGKKFPVCVSADTTLTFHAAKSACFLADGPDVCGEIRVPDILLAAGGDAGLITAGDVAPVWGKRRANTHKGDYGRLLIVAGSTGMAGAAALCASSAMRSGAGLVTVACTSSVLPVVQTLTPCATCLLLPGEGAIADGAAQVLEGVLPGFDAVAAGPGLSRAASRDVLSLLLESGKKCVFDADALNILAENEELLSLLNENHLITPHPGEAARLLGRACASPVDDARSLARRGNAALLKGRATVIARGNDVRISASGTPGMARGGSGDVLTGCCGALLARGLDPLDAGSAAAYTCGRAGELAAASRGEWGMSPLDTVEHLPDAIRAIAQCL